MGCGGTVEFCQTPSVTTAGVRKFFRKLMELRANVIRSLARQDNAPLHATAHSPPVIVTAHVYIELQLTTQVL